MSFRRSIAGALAAGVGAVLLALSAGPQPVLAAAPRTPAPSARHGLLWATVNVCDSTGYPDGVGIRGSMPGTGSRRDALFMRLRLQFLLRGRWRDAGHGGDSGWVEAGNGAARSRQLGRTFTVTPPPARRAYLLRGVVSFQWRRDGDVIRRARRVTQPGHPDTPGADPPGYSAGTCAIR